MPDGGTWPVPQLTRRQEADLCRRILAGRARVRKVLSECARVQDILAQLAQRITAGEEHLEAYVDRPDIQSSTDKRNQALQQFRDLARHYGQQAFGKTAAVIERLPLFKSQWDALLGVMEEEASTDPAVQASFADARGEDQDVSSAVRELVGGSLPLVLAAIQKYGDGRVPAGVLMEAGTRGLMHAIDHFEQRGNYRFSTYATLWIRHELQATVPIDPPRGLLRRLRSAARIEKKMADLSPPNKWVN